MEQHMISVEHVFQTIDVPEILVFLLMEKVAVMH